MLVLTISASIDKGLELLVKSYLQKGKVNETKYDLVDKKSQLLQYLPAFK
jgi:hypothetical protein